MKETAPTGKTSALTVVEVLVVIGVVAIFLMLLLPANSHKPTRAPNWECNNNLRQIGLALHLFASDNKWQYPPEVSITNGGSLEFIGSNSPALHFRTLSNYMGGNRSVWHCPADQSKQALTNDSPLADRNLSYFISVDTTQEKTNAIQAGDRNLELAGQPVKPGLFTLTTNTEVGWTREMHSKDARTRRGNILLSDGSVEGVRTNLSAAVQSQGLDANRLAVP